MSFPNTVPNYGEAFLQEAQVLFIQMQIYFYVCDHISVGYKRR